MKTLRVTFILAILVLLAFPSGVLAQSGDPLAPDALGLTVSPDPQYPGQSVTVGISNAVMTTDASNGFCFYTESNIYVTLPASISLTQAGPGGGAKTFSLSEGPASAHCDDLDSTTDDWWYLRSSPYPVGNKTYSGSFAVTLPTTATLGLHAWTMYIDSSGEAFTALHTIASTPSVVYASDLANCGGYGTAGVSCFQSLKAAYNKAVAYNASDLVIVSDLTVNPGTEANITSTLVLIRETASGRLVAGGTCTNQTLLTLAKSSLTVRGLSLNGAACSGAATGIAVDTGGDVTLDNVTIRDFSSGTGLAFTGSGAGTLKNSKGSITGNVTGVSDTSSGVISIGTGPTDGNTISNNTVGLRTDGGITIKGNDISGGTYGVELQGAPTAFYGNRVTGASTQQIYCNGATAGAAWNYLGGTSPSSGSDCSDVDAQLGSNFVSWSDGGVVSGLSVGGAVIATFDLANNLPFGYGSTTGRTSNYFAVYDNATADSVTVGGTGTYQYKMFVPPNTGGICPTGTEHSCWDSIANGRAQSGSGYFYKGNQDPTAITLSNLSATPHAEMNGLWIALILAVSVLLSGAWWLRRQAQRA